MTNKIELCPRHLEKIKRYLKQRCRLLEKLFTRFFLPSHMYNFVIIYEIFSGF